ncbi:hypothetical protein JDV02_003736 [Purpureocillium takamizusanense]|uniref:Uncharacterized protein n=1 Tax=Purpureocillium takamizusanense TaxID=2060973 RepID=A0A9Q8QB61_9HYPO|nr:uncharacterized protein JDV02_003736 [Purpureocillium takamizusanense]UNI17394.1 hypothetical protein JDV02_003736 [Purpureocillium takamizusanense]
MAPTKRNVRSKPVSSSSSNGSPPVPFKRPPEVLESFASALNEKHVYVTHIDSRPAAFKRKIFLVPVAMNLCVSLLFAWRMYAILPWYWQLVVSAFGYQSDATFPASQSTWGQLAWEIARRGVTMFIDFMLFVFVWPWPVEFTAGQRHGNPVLWRRTVGFRDQEIYVRRSRDWDRLLRDIFKDADSRKILTAYIQQATSPLLQEQKTGYLLMNSQWDLDWEAMVYAHQLVDTKAIALEAFKNVVLVHHKDYGWLCYDLKAGSAVEEDDKRRQVFAFRDALTGLGKEDLFYRWVEIVQFEATQPGGFGPEKQEEAAKKIRNMFEKENINFDELWKESVGG